ncbi:Chitinase 2 [Candida parapsilosis]|nr:Chitinase 2 [Candida parapsilosis]
MRGAFTISAFVAAATAAASDAITIRSTTISSTCSSSSTSSDVPVLPSSALSGGYYGNSSIPVTSASETTSKTKKISYQYETAYATNAVDITRTVCDSNGQCYVTTDVGKLTTYTTTIDGILTVITTGVPVEPTEASATEQSTPETSSFYQSNAGKGATGTHSEARETSTTESPQSISKETTAPKESKVSEESTTSKESTTSIASSNGSDEAKSLATTTTAAPLQPQTQYLTTLVTITSCSENKCSEVPKTTGVKIISELDTVYTTYCPLTEVSEPSTTTTASHSEAPHSEAPHSEVPHSEAPHSEAPHSEAPHSEAPHSEVPHSEAPKSSTEIPQESTEAPATSTEVAKPETSATSTKSKSQATVNVITDNIVTETPSVEQQQATSQETVANESTSTTSESPSINTYEGAAMSVSGATGFITVAISVLMLMI